MYECVVIVVGVVDLETFPLLCHVMRAGRVSVARGGIFLCFLPEMAFNVRRGTHAAENSNQSHVHCEACDLKSLLE